VDHCRPGQLDSLAKKSAAQSHRAKKNATLLEELEKLIAAMASIFSCRASFQGARRHGLANLVGLLNVHDSGTTVPMPLFCEWCIGVNSENHYGNVNVRDASIFQIPNKLLEIRNARGHFIGK